MKNINQGDTIKVETREPSFFNKRDLLESVVQHNAIYDDVVYDPKDYFKDAPKGG